MQRNTELGTLNKKLANLYVLVVCRTVLNNPHNGHYLKKQKISDKLKDLEYSLRAGYCISLNNTVTMTDMNKVQKSILTEITFIF